MKCEICDKHIERGKKVRVEGSIVTTCNECSGYGEIIAEVTPPHKKKRIAKETGHVDGYVKFELKMDELVGDYSSIIRRTREKRGMTQKDLANSINEPVSLIHRIESGKLKPSNLIIKKIQRKLGIRLLDTADDIRIHEIKTNVSKELTLGDLAVVRKKIK